MVKKAKALGQDEFKLGDVVAAKVKGHPTWPGLIEQINEDHVKNRKQYVVRFFVSQDTSKSFQNLKRFDQMTASERSCKRKGFQLAMKACEEHMNSIAPKNRAQASQELLKDCSLNDLTSEQANADRGNKPPSSKNTPMQVTKRELTLAKLKKKIDTKLEEKKQKKEAFKQQKSFEKASKGLPTLRRKFQPLSKSSQHLLAHIDNTEAANQVETSMKECEKYLESLAKCLKLMHSDYGAQQKECFDFHKSLRKIVISLKDIEAKDQSLPIALACADFLDKLRTTDGIKAFMNEMKFPQFSDTVAERKENAKDKRKKTVR